MPQGSLLAVTVFGQWVLFYLTKACPFQKGKPWLSVGSHCHMRSVAEQMLSELEVSD